MIILKMNNLEIYININKSMKSIGMKDTIHYFIIDPLIIPSPSTTKRTYNMRVAESIFVTCMLTKESLLKKAKKEMGIW